MLKHITIFLFLIIIFFNGDSSAQTWQRTNGPLGGMIKTIAVDNDGFIFAGNHVGIFCSTDRGSTWNQVSTESIEEIAINSSGHLYTVGNNLLRSTDHGTTWTKLNNGMELPYQNSIAISPNGDIFVGGQSGSIFRSTDNGDTWTQIGTGLTTSTFFSIGINNNGAIFAGCSDYGRIFRSTDDGLNWTQVRIGVVYYDYIFSISFNSKGHIFCGGSTGVLKSDDNGITWTQVNTGLTAGDIRCITINSNDVIFAGTSSGEGGGIFRSTNDGADWEKTIDGLSNINVNSLFSTQSRIYTATNGGIYYSTNNGEIWNEYPLTTTWITSLTSTSNGNIYAGVFGDGVAFSTNNGENWTRKNSGLTNLYTEAIGTNAEGHIFASSSYGIFRTTNEGTTWTQANISYSTGTNATIKTFASKANGFLFAGGYVLKDDKYVGALFRSTNNGAAWIQKADLAAGEINSIIVNKDGEIFAGGIDNASAWNGVLFHSTDNGENWDRIPLSFQSPVNDMAINSHSTIFIGTSGGIYRSTDNGSTWIQVSTYLNIHALTINSMGHIFIGSYDGSVLSSTDNGASWSKLGIGSPILALTTDINNFVYIGTNDKGVFRSVQPTVITPFIQLLTPNGGENWNAGSQQIITWTSSNVENVKIEYTIDNGTNWLQIFNNIPANSGSYNWTVPNTPSMQCKLKISDASDGSVGDLSNNFFNILPQASITIISPNGGENWNTGSKQNITWTSSNVENIKIEYTTDNGTNWIQITASTPANTGSYSWTVPNTPSANCKVRISDIRDANKNDVSENTFAISPPIVWTETQPAGNIDGGWQSTAINSDGTRIMAGSWDRGLFISGNGGSNWTSIQPGQNNNFQTISMSSDGTKIIAGEYSGRLYISTNSGSSWTETQPAGNVDKIWIMSSMSSDGTCMIAGAGNGGRLYISTNSGSSWTETQPAGNVDQFWSTTSMNSDGVTLVAGCNERLYVSKNSGNSWIETQPAGNVDQSWSTTSISSDGSRLIAGSQKLYMSTDGGSNWTETQPAGNANKNWTETSMSSDGTCIIAGENNGRLYISTNSGNSWIETQPDGDVNQAWSTTSMSSNGSWLMAGANNGRLFFGSLASLAKNISITSPNGGENFQAGSQQNITWTSNNVENIKIEFTADNGINWAGITASTPANTGSYAFTVPYISSNQCKIKLSDAANNSVFDESNNSFTIQDLTPKLKVVSPNGGEAFTAGQAIRIGFLSINVSTVKFDYSTDAGNTWLSIASNVSSDPLDYSTKSLDWNIPSVNSNECLVRMLDINDLAIGDSSDSFFTISSLKITSPNGGESWQSGSQQNISWTSTNIENVKLEYTTDNGTNWTQIVESTPVASGSYSWTIPNTHSIHCKVRISDATNELIRSLSGNFFTIYSSASIRVLTPNGGDNWIAGSTNGIQWQSIAVTNVKIELSTDNGTSWVLVASSVASGQATNYDWLVPDFSSANCLIKISDVNNPSTFDVSDNVFRIIPASESFIAVTSPNSGEVWPADSQRTITWESQYVPKVRIELSSDSGINWNYTITDSTESDGEYLWTVPDISSNSCRIRIIDINNREIADTSNTNFSIAQAAQAIISIISPNGGEIWNAGEEKQITWDYQNIDTIRIEFSSDNALNWIILTEGIAASSEVYNWIIPQIPSSECFIKISNKTNPTIYDISQSAFSISNPQKEITILFPKGGEKLMYGYPVQIKWTCSSLTGNAQILFSKDNGANWTELTNQANINVHSFIWQLPEINSNDCLVNIKCVDDVTVTDISDGKFSINTYPANLNVTKNYKFYVGNSPESYRMIGLPGNIDQPINELISGNYGSDWRLFYDNGANENNMVEYSQGASGFNFQPGKGFWIISKNGLSVNKVMASVGLRKNDISDPSLYYTKIKINRGWTIISNPFEKEILWENVKLANGITEDIHEFDGIYSSSIIFKPYSAYYYYNNSESDSLIIPYLMKSQNNKPFLGKSSVLKEINLRLLKEGKPINSEIVIGIDDSSNNKYDKYDRYAPPGNFLKERMVIRNDEIEGKYKYLCKDYRQVLNEKQEYFLEIRKEKNGKYQLELEDPAGLLNDKAAYLIDERLQRAVEVKDMVEIGNIHLDGLYRLIIGQRELIEEELKDLIPQEYKLFQNYPNPFNGNTVFRFSLPKKDLVTLEIYTILGEKVRTLISNSEYEAGSYEFEFDGSGLVSGVYIYRLSTMQNSASNKMIYLK